MSMFTRGRTATTIHRHMHYLDLFIAGLAGLLTLLIAEYGYIRKWWQGEGARKFAHIVIGVQVAIWPFYLDWFEIRLISIVLTIGFIVCMRLRVFKSIGAVDRLSYGEVLFALAIGGLTLITQSHAIYAVAVLHLSVADGLAALMGLRFGKRTRYKVFGHTKSVVGSAAFFFVSLALLSTYAVFWGTISLPWVITGALIATALENIGVYGVDNILVPVSIVALLSFL